MLQRAGVAAIPTFLDSDLLDDPHLLERGSFVQLEHPEVGSRPLAGVPYWMSLTPCEVRKPAPCLGAGHRAGAGGNALQYARKNRRRAQGRNHGMSSPPFLHRRLDGGQRRPPY